MGSPASSQAGWARARELEVRAAQGRGGRGDEATPGAPSGFNSPLFAPAPEQASPAPPSVEAAREVAAAARDAKYRRLAQRFSEPEPPRGGAAAAVRQRQEQRLGP